MTAAGLGTARDTASSDTGHDAADEPTGGSRTLIAHDGERGGPPIDSHDGVDHPPFKFRRFA